MSARLQSFGDRLARLLGLLAVLAVGGYFAVDWLRGPPDAAAELRQANPGWTVDKPRHAGLRLADGGPEVFINADDAGPLRVQRLDCALLLSRLPAWLSLPVGRTGSCLQIGDAAPFTLVLNHRTPEPIPQLWTHRYEPQLDELKLPHWGGWSGGGADGPASTTPGRRYRSMSYGIDPAPGSGDPRVGLMAFYLGDETVMVVTLRPPAGP